MKISQLLLTSLQNKDRFESSRGDLTIELLFDLVITSDNSDIPNLNDIGKELNRQIKEITDNNIIVTNTNQNKKVKTLTRKLEIVKYIANYKQKQTDNNKKRQEKLILLQDEYNMYVETKLKKTTDGVFKQEPKIIDEKIAELKNQIDKLVD